MPQITHAQIEEVSGLVANYIRTQRQAFVGRATVLPAPLQFKVNSFFRAEVLNSTRVVVLENEKVANPDFYPMLQGLGFTNLLDFEAWQRSRSTMWLSRTNL